MTMLSAVAGQLGAEGPASADPRVKDQLDRLGVHYTITDSGNYSITFDLDTGRSQVVYVMGQTETYKGTEIRELWSRAGIFDEIPSAEVMQSLLEESGTSKIGFWSIEKNDAGGYIVYFSIKVPVYLKDADFRALLEFTADTADAKEAELFSSDNE